MENSKKKKNIKIYAIFFFGNGNLSDCRFILRLYNCKDKESRKL